jgi:hypothetical protein
LLVFARRRVKHALDVVVDRPHRTNPREHRWPVKFRSQQYRLHHDPPFVGTVFCLRQFGDVLRSVSERDHGCFRSGNMIGSKKR